MKMRTTNDPKLRNRLSSCHDKLPLNDKNNHTFLDFVFADCIENYE